MDDSCLDLQQFPSLLSFILVAGHRVPTKNGVNVHVDGVNPKIYNRVNGRMGHVYGARLVAVLVVR